MTEQASDSTVPSLIVSHIEHGSPAQKINSKLISKLKPSFSVGEVLLAINGESTLGMSPLDASTRIGQIRSRGEQVSLTIQTKPPLTIGEKSGQTLVFNFAMAQGEPLELGIRFADRGTPEGEKAEKVAQANNRGAIVVAVVLLALIVFGFVSCNNSVNETRANEPAVARCLSSWDGASRDMIDAVKARLREPGSFEHVNTSVSSIVDVNNTSTIRMQYRARNGFGGMNQEIATGRINVSTCRVTLDY